MSRSQRRKGHNAEREVVRLLHGRGISARRILNQVRDPGLSDIDSEIGRIEVKRRATGFRQLYAWLDKTDADLLFIRADRKQWLVVMPVDRFLSDY